MRFHILFTGLSLSVALAGLSSCNHYTYSPGTVVTPFIEGKHRVSVTANTTALFLSNNLELQAIYNPFKRITVSAGYCNLASKFPEEGGQHRYSIRYGDGMVGGWLPKYLDMLTVGLFAGYSAGTSSNFFGKGSPTKLQFQKAYLQPTFRIDQGALRFGMGFRFSQLSFGNGVVDLVAPTSFIEQTEHLEKDAPFSLVEGGFTLGFYNQPLTVSLSVATTRFLGSNQKLDYYGFDDSNFSMGLQIDINDLGKRMHKKNRRFPPNPPVQTDH